MALVSSMRGYQNWGKKKGLNQKQIQNLIKAYQFEEQIDLKANKVFYPNQHDKIEQSRKRFMAFTQWYAKQK